jgi:hypothetical protein
MPVFLLMVINMAAFQKTVQQDVAIAVPTKPMRGVSSRFKAILMNMPIAM